MRRPQNQFFFQNPSSRVMPNSVERYVFTILPDYFVSVFQNFPFFIFDDFFSFSFHGTIWGKNFKQHLL